MLVAPISRILGGSLTRSLIISHSPTRHPPHAHSFFSTHSFSPSLSPSRSLTLSSTRSLTQARPQLPFTLWLLGTPRLAHSFPPLPLPPPCSPTAHPPFFFFFSFLLFYNNNNNNN
eukprot:GHVU01084604.1.p1 GENE.GHVU01084604.1~~GHVU01084604.1.p1  ORF type:complete len:116 (-),score=2.96 GHVU01084604.1:76-423(-)